MYLDRDRENNKMTIIEKDKEVLSMSYIFDEFVWKVNPMAPVIITKQVDEVFYNNLINLFDNEYLFNMDEKLSNKSKNKIKWLSDQNVDLDNVAEIDKITRLVIEKKEDKVYIYVINPFYNGMGIVKDFYTVAFSPLGNGYCTKNKETGMSFQDDMAMLFSYTMDGIDMTETDSFQKKLV